MNAVEPQPRTEQPPEPAIYGEQAQAQPALNVRPGWKQPLRDMRPRDVIEVGVTFERMRRRTPIAWLQSGAAAVSGAGLGAVLDGGGGVGAYAALFVGAGLVVGIQFAIHERNVDVANACGQFLRLMDQYPPMGEHELPTNSAYVRTIVASENPSLLTRFQNRWHGRKSRTHQP